MEKPPPRKRLAPFSTAARLLFQEKLGETEAALGQLARVLVADQGHSFFADFREENLPSPLRQLFAIDARARLLLRLLLGPRLLLLRLRHRRGLCFRRIMGFRGSFDIHRGSGLSLAGLAFAFPAAALAFVVFT